MVSDNIYFLLPWLNTFVSSDVLYAYFSSILSTKMIPDLLMGAGFGRSLASEPHSADFLLNDPEQVTLTSSVSEYLRSGNNLYYRRVCD